MRNKIPKTKEAEILFLNRHACCICHDKNRDVQIHHIDGNNSNNNISNLAIMCLDCHSKVTGKRGLGKRYSELEVKRYKQEWETVVKKEFRLPLLTKSKEVPKIEKQLFIYEIKRMIYQMISADDFKKDYFDKGFETLWNISLLEDIQKETIEQLQYAFSLTAISQTNKPIALANALPQFFNYLVGPREIKLRKSDEKNILEAVETIEFCHNMSVEQNKKYKILKSFKTCLSDFIQISIRYKNPKIFRKAITIINEIKISSATLYHKNDHKIPKLNKEIQVLYSDIKKELKRTKLPWGKYIKFKD
jgi:hypothetical protein